MICSPCTSSTELSVSPVRPINCITGVQDHDGWKNLRDLPFEALDIDARELVDNYHEVDADNGEVARVPRGLPEPSEPTAAMRARHNLKLWPCRNLCEHCVAARRANTKHPHSPLQAALSPSLFPTTVFCAIVGTETLHPALWAI